MTTTTALIFPGQGSQRPGMGDLVAAHRPDLLDALSDLVDDDVFERADEGTAFQQPAVFCASLAVYEALGRPTASAFAGHSLGEIAALTAAGVFSDVDGLRIVVERGRAMQRAGELNPGSLIAVIGPAAAAHELAESCGLSIANENAPDQVVLAGEPAALDAACVAARDAGLRAVRLPVGGAFHSDAMAPAAAHLAAVLDDIPLGPASARVLSCATGQEFLDVRSELVGALTRPVRWVDTVQALADAGVERFVEVGPGRVLSGLVRRIVPGATVVRGEEEVSVGV